MLDSWNPKTFSGEVYSVLSDHSKLIRSFYEEDRMEMEEYLNSSPHQSLKSNRFHSAYSELSEQIIAPILARSRLRVWHYTRLTEYEVKSMRQKLVLSSLDYLSDRLENLVSNTLLTHEEAETVYAESPLHSQRENRAGQMWTTTIPFRPSYGGVEPLLESWGGESAYFRLSNKKIAAKLKQIGSPRIVELETTLSGSRNGRCVSDTVLQAWAKKLGLPVPLSGCDLPVSNCIDTAKVVRVHTKGDTSFQAVATAYPEDACALLGE